MVTPLTPFPRFYPIGTPGQPWSAADISEWRAQQVRRRSHADDVVMPLQRLADRLTLVPYGELPDVEKHKDALVNAVIDSLSRPLL